MLSGKTVSSEKFNVAISAGICRLPSVFLWNLASRAASATQAPSLSSIIPMTWKRDIISFVRNLGKGYIRASTQEVTELFASLQDSKAESSGNCASFLRSTVLLGLGEGREGEGKSGRGTAKTTQPFSQSQSTR